MHDLKLCSGYKLWTVWLQASTPAHGWTSNHLRFSHTVNSHMRLHGSISRVSAAQILVPAIPTIIQSAPAHYKLCTATTVGSPSCSRSAVKCHGTFSVVALYRGGRGLCVKGSLLVVVLLLGEQRLLCLLAAQMHAQLALHVS
jgi:hypothetical protein